MTAPGANEALSIGEGAPGMTPEQRLAALAARQSELDAEQLRIATEAAAILAAEREEAILAALDLYDGAVTSRANALAHDLRRYLANGWLRERKLDLLQSASPKREAWHRIARSRNGEGLGQRQIMRAATKTCVMSSA